MKASLHTEEMRCACLYINNEILSECLMLWDVDHQCFSELVDILILSSLLLVLHKFIAQDSRIIFRAI